MKVPHDIFFRTFAAVHWNGLKGLRWQCGWLLALAVLGFQPAVAATPDNEGVRLETVTAEVIGMETAANMEPAICSNDKPEVGGLWVVPEPAAALLGGIGLLLLLRRRRRS